MQAPHLCVGADGAAVQAQGRSFGDGGRLGVHQVLSHCGFNEKDDGRLITPLKWSWSGANMILCYLAELLSVYV